MEHYSAIRKGNTAICDNMDLDIMLNKTSQTGKDKNHVISLVGYKTKQQTIKTKFRHRQQYEGKGVGEKESEGGKVRGDGRKLDFG